MKERTHIHISLFLSSAYQYVIPPHSNGLVKTDLAIAMPDGCYGRVGATFVPFSIPFVCIIRDKQPQPSLEKIQITAPRSGLALKHQIDVGAGVIDADYRGNIGIVLFNHSDKPFKVYQGDRVAQLILEKICYADVEDVRTTLDETNRGTDGFGSTGVSSTSHT